MVYLCTCIVASLHALATAPTHFYPSVPLLISSNINTLRSEMDNLHRLHCSRKINSKSPGRCDRFTPQYTIPLLLHLLHHRVRPLLLLLLERLCLRSDCDDDDDDDCDETEDERDLDRDRGIYELAAKK
jgi:hypothetical protein